MKISIDGLSEPIPSKLHKGRDEELLIDTEKVFRGIWVPIITPFHNQRVDLRALQRLTENITSHGVHGLVVCGTTGEASALSQKEQMNVLMAVQEVVGISYPLLMGINGIDTASTVKKVLRMNSFDITGYLVSVPPYVRPSQQGLLMHFSKIAQASRLPLVLYNNPTRTGVNMEIETSRTISNNPKYIGIKESGDDLTQLKALATDTPLRLFAGDDKLLMQTLEYGAVGAISAAAHIRPDLYVRIYRLVQEGKHLEALQLFNILLPLIRLLFQEPSPGPIKALLAYQGHIREELRLPMTPVSIHHRNELIKALDRLNFQTA